jgi:hypothetical protein
MKEELIQKRLIPLDKSWIIRMGFLDIINGKKDIFDFLDSQKNLNDDLLALKRVSETWNTEHEINVGESGTIYRFFKFASWKLNLNKKFILEGTLVSRAINNDESIIDLPLKELLKLDNNTSQWASAAILFGKKEVIENPPYKLQVTYDALRHWNEMRVQNKTWEPRYDETILNQALTFLKLRNKEKVNFIPEQAEDYCFARILNFISKEEGEKRWPALRGHESDRIAEMERVMRQLQDDEDVTSKDHRVVQAAGLYKKLYNSVSKILYPKSVNKSWPQFWDFIEFASK